MSTPASTFRQATPADASVVADVAERTFRATFERDNTPDNINTLCRLAYGEDIQRREIENPLGETWLVERSGRTVGYFMLRHSTSPRGLAGTRPVEILRLYLDNDQQGSGEGRRLMQFALERCAVMGGDVAWLGVWERNAKAIGFYERLGFTVFGSHIFRVGDDPQTDLLMQRGLG